MKLIHIINSYNATDGVPRYYLKADTALLRNNDAFYVPEGVGRVVAEPHIVLRTSRLAKCVGERFASRCIDAVMAGVSFTQLDLLDEACRMGMPWDEAVGFDHSSALSLDMLSRDAMLEGASFMINDEVRARINIADMAFSVDRVVSRLSECMTLRIGDLIYLGAPKQFEVKIGDNYKVAIGDKVLLNFDIK